MTSDVRSALVGVIAGMRSSSAPALVSRINARDSQDGTRASDLLGLLFLGELVADKLPFVPARTRPASLLARLLSGAISAARLDRSRSERLRAALIGTAGALGATFLFYQLRKQLAARCDVPDYLLALGEDALLIGLALWLLKQRDGDELTMRL